LEKLFNQLPTEGKITLKKFIQTIVAIQDTAIGAVSTEDERAGVKGH
jgi:hypothetical protein